MAVIHIGIASTLAAIPKANISDGDIAYIWLNSYTRTMVFDSTATDATDTSNHPYYQRPDDYGAGPGVWIEDVGIDQPEAWSANQIITGQLTSINWGASTGSEYDLDLAKFRLGGSNVNAAGTVSGIFMGLDSGVYKFYIGDGSNKYIKFDGTDLSISIENIKILAGGDIEMHGGAGNTSYIKFYDTSNVLTGSMFSAAGNWIGLYPATTNKNCYIGNNSDAKWQNAGIYAKDNVYMQAIYDTDDYAYFKSHSENAASYALIKISTNGTVRRIYLSGNVFAPGTSSHKLIDLGAPTAAWDDCNADDFNNVADFYNFDRHDDLGVINQIKGSGIIQEHNGYELIDDNTLPLWLLSKYKKDGEFKEEETQEIINIWKKGDVMRDPEGKPYLSLKTCISLAWGAIRQLDKKIEQMK